MPTLPSPKLTATYIDFHLRLPEICPRLLCLVLLRLNLLLGQRNLPLEILDALTQPINVLVLLLLLLFQL